MNVTGRTLFMLTTADVSKTVAGLMGLGMRNIEIGHKHRSVEANTSKLSLLGLSNLCAVAEPEYVHFQLPKSPFCMKL